MPKKEIDLAMLIRPDLQGDPVQVVAHAVAIAVLARTKGDISAEAALTPDAILRESSKHFDLACDVLRMFPHFDPQNTKLLACMDRIDAALCNYLNGCGDSFEPVSEWDDESWNNFKNLSEAYNDWHKAAS